MRYASILIVLTEQCHVGCAHCGYIGSRRDGEVESEELERWIEQIVDYGVPEIIFTGGEAFERYEILARGVKRARECGVPSSVFTSSFWATSVEQARTLLSGLDGLKHIYFSTDTYHQDRVPFSHVRNAIDAAISLDIPTLSLNITYASEADRSSIAAHYQDYGDRIAIHGDRVIPNPKFSPKVLARQDPLVALTAEKYSTTCWLGTPLVDPNGDLFACHIGKAAAHRDMTKLPYFLGNLRNNSFAEIMSRSKRRVDYQYLRTHGPQGVAEMAQNSPELLEQLPGREFTTACDMCMCVLKSPKGAESLSAYAEKQQEKIDIRLTFSLEEQPVLGEWISQPLQSPLVHISNAK
jgi:MoaA/NifB/PqqE/SkfB family radical SAM enzyme